MKDDCVKIIKPCPADITNDNLETSKLYILGQCIIEIYFLVEYLVVDIYVSKFLEYTRSIIAHMGSMAPKQLYTEN